MEKNSHLLLIDIDSQGTINIIYPAYEHELRIIRADRDLFLPDVGEVVPAFGTDYVKAFAFTNQPSGLKDLMGRSFSPASPLFRKLMDMLARADETNTSEASLQVRTCSRADIR